MQFTALVQLIGRAREGGARHVSGGTWQWDVSGKCQSPVHVELIARPPQWYQHRRWADASDPLVRAAMLMFPGAYIEEVRASPSGWHRWVTVKPGAPHTLELRQDVPCRKCSQCLKQKRQLWQRRAMAEFSQSSRTWLVTLTLSPDSHYQMQSRAIARLHKSGSVWELLTDADKFAERHKEVSAEITLLLKRLREKTKAQLRYILVLEAHKSGLPHYHMLIHEGLIGVTKRALEAEWPWGFTSAKLVHDPQGAAYVCKYLSKSMMARVRASIRYGERSELERAKRIASETSVLKSETLQSNNPSSIDGDARMHRLVDGDFDMETEL